MVIMFPSYSRGYSFDSQLTVVGFIPGFPLIMQIKGKYFDEIGLDRFLPHTSESSY
jgi:hypothetical protein